MRWPRRTLAVLAVLWALPARGDDPSAADVAAARLLAVEGVKLANAGNCKDAIEKLARAESLRPAATILGRLGECQVAVGKLVEGTENLRRAAREPLPSGAPPAFVKARARAEKALAAAAPRVAHLHVVLDAPPDAKAALTVDGQPLRPELVGADRPTDPGPHVVEATAPGYLTATENVNLADGAETTVKLTLKLDPNGGPEAPPVAVTPPPPPAPSRPSRLPAVIAFATGGAGLVLGGIFGGVALAERGSLDSQCNASKVCPISAQGTLDALHTTSTVSTIGFVVAGVGAAAGAVLLFVPSGKSATKSEQGAALQTWIGPTGGGVAGRF